MFTVTRGRVVSLERLGANPERTAGAAGRGESPSICGALCPPAGAARLGVDCVPWGMV